MFIMLREYIINIEEILYIKLDEGIKLDKTYDKFITIILKDKKRIDLYKLEGQSNDDLKVEFKSIYYNINLNDEGGKNVN